MQNNLIDKIRTEIEKSGFPLELYVLDICSKKNTGRMPNVRYKNNGEIREIDLYAFFENIILSPQKSENFQHTSTSMIIECKKSTDKPWIFFSSNIYNNDSLLCFLKYVSNFDFYFNKENKHSLMGQIYKSLENNHYKDRNIPKCITYFEAFKNPDQPSNIYKAIDSVLSFLKYKMEFYSRKCNELGFFTNFFLPIIVYDGHLFEADIDGHEITIKEEPHIQLRTDYDDEIYIIDVVQKEYFSNFFDSIEKNHLEFINAINQIEFSEEHKTKMKTNYEKEMQNFKLNFPIEFYCEVNEKE